jgi:hypothetical protein
MITEKGRKNMNELLAERVQALLSEEPCHSMFRCPECGSFFDSPRIDPKTGNLGRKCVSCLEWYPVAGLRREGAA